MSHKNNSLGSQALSEVEPLDPEVFYILYQAALDVDSPTEKRKNALLVVGMGRLGLSPSMLAHMHEAWVDWRAGVVRVPAHDPCACTDCLERVRVEMDISDLERAASASVSVNWSPPGEFGDRAIPFGWSRRLTAVLMEFFERYEYLQLEVPIDRRLHEIADRATAIDPDAVTSTKLRASAAQTYAELGYDADELRQLLGIESRAVAERFVRRATPIVDQRAGGSLHFERFRVVSNPKSFADEPFDPTTFDADAREERAKRLATTSERVSNPRPVAPELNSDPTITPAVAEFLDPDSKLLSLDDDSVQSLAEAWVERHDSRNPPDRLDAPRLQNGGVEAGPQSVRERAQPPEGGSQATDGEQAATAASEWGPQPSTVDALAGTEVQRLDTAFASPAVTDGNVHEGTVVLTGEELLFDVSEHPMQEGALAYRIPLSAVVNVAPEYSPQAVEDRFEAGIGLKVDLDDDQQVVALDLPRARREAFMTDLFAQLLDGATAVVTSPQKEGGRVMGDMTTRLARLHIENDRLELSHHPDADEDVDEDDPEKLTTVYLGRVTDIGQCLQKYDTKTWKSLEIQHLPDQTSITSQVGLETKQETNLLRKFVQQQYKRRMDELRQLSLSAEEKQLLVGLHSMGDMDLSGMNLASMLSMDEQQLSTLLDRLESKNLVTRGDDGTALTDTGHVAVSEKLDDVNF